jgi:hypothetical protein
VCAIRRVSRAAVIAVRVILAAMSSPPNTYFATALAVALSACGGQGTVGSMGDASTGDASVARDAGAVDASVVDATGEASVGDAAVEASVGNAAVEASVADAGSCSTHGLIAVAGDYTGPDGTGYWLRKSATAATFTVVPAGAPVPSALPQLFRVEDVCPRWLLLESTDGRFGRVDWATVGGGLGICVRASASARAVTALALPDPGNAATGCAGSAWIALTPVTP